MAVAAELRDEHREEVGVGIKIAKILSLALTRGYLAFYRRFATIKPLTSEHQYQVALLLTEQFCLREPLCRNLKLDVAQLLPFFRHQVSRACELDLGLVALDSAGQVLGAVILEDHADPYVPGEDFLTPEFRAIGALLDQVSLPESLQEMPKGRLVYCALAAVKPGRHRAPILSMLTMAVSARMIPRGYSKGYAKVTNPRIIANFRKIERLLGGNLFFLSEEKSAKDFPPGAFSPLTDFYVAVVYWNLAFLGWSKNGLKPIHK